MADADSPSFEEGCVVAFLLRELGEPAGILFESVQAADSKQGDDLSAQVER